MNDHSAVRYIKTQLSEISTHLANEIHFGKYRYETFGKQIEEPVTEIVKKLLEKGKIIKGENDIEISENKNQFPDIRLNLDQVIAIEIKSGCHSKKKKKKWEKTKNSNNDLGTLNSWPKKFKQYDGNNIYYLFIEYDVNHATKVIEIKNITLELFYKYVGINRDGMLKYREKDGNLRPRDFDQKAQINSFEEFNKLFVKTVIYRSKRIITKHLKSLSKLEQKKLLENIYKRKLELF